MSNRNEFYMQITMQNSAKLCMQWTPYKKISEIANMIKNKKKKLFGLWKLIDLAGKAGNVAGQLVGVLRIKGCLGHFA